MEKESLRAIAKELGVSRSYISQVIHGVRPASEKVLTTLLTSGLLRDNFLTYNEAKCQRSSGVEQRFRNSMLKCQPVVLRSKQSLSINSPKPVL